MKQLLFFILLLAGISSSHYTNAQTPEENGVTRAYNKIASEYITDSILVSDYTFNRLAYREFARITTGDDAFSKVQRYASLSIKPEESKFYFSPLILTNYNSSSANRLQHIVAVDASGTISNDNVFKLKDFRTLKLGVSYTYVLNKWGFSSLNYADRTNRKSLLDCIKNKAIQTKGDMCSKYIHDGDEAERAQAAEDAFLSEYSEAEEKWADNDGWNAKNIYWIKANVNVLSWDHFKYYNPTLPSSLINLSDTTVFTPSGSVVLSYYRISKNSKLRLYGTISGGISMRHQISEVGQAEDWNKYNKINDSIYLAKDNQSIYALSENVKTKATPDFGVQLIGMYDFSKAIRLGLNISAQYKGLVIGNGSASMITTDYGIVFPFLDKDGNTSINVEIFYQNDFYNNIQLDNNKFWGARFSLPINQL